MKRQFASGCGTNWIKGAITIAVCAATMAVSIPVLPDTVTRANAPGYTTERTGAVDDFDYFKGAWTTRQRRLKARGVGSTEWEEFPATLCMSPYLGGMATVDEIWFPTKQWAGLTVRAFDLQKRQWSIYWISSANGRMGTPVVGGFQGSRGEFYGEDQDGDRPVKVRFLWNKIDAHHARWEQAFSYDDRTWETNWTADFVRASATEVCEASGSQRPKRAAKAGVT